MCVRVCIYAFEVVFAFALVNCTTTVIVVVFGKAVQAQCVWEGSRQRLLQEILETFRTHGQAGVSTVRIHRIAFLLPQNDISHQRNDILTFFPQQKCSFRDLAEIKSLVFSFFSKCENGHK